MAELLQIVFQIREFIGDHPLLVLTSRNLEHPLLDVYSSMYPNYMIFKLRS